MWPRKIKPNSPRTGGRFLKSGGTAVMTTFPNMLGSTNHQKTYEMQYVGPAFGLTPKKFY